MLSERERRQFEEIVRGLRDDSGPDAQEPALPASALAVTPPAGGRWQRVVRWAGHRFEQRLERQEMIVCRRNREQPWAT